MASRFWVGNSGTWDAADTTHWAATSGGAGGQSVPGSGDTVTIDAASGTGTITVNTNFSVISVTCGAMNMTLDFATNNNSPTIQTFSCSGTGTRTLNMGSGTWTITGNAATVFNITTTTNLTLNAGSSTINATYAGATGTRSFVVGVGFQVNNLNITAGTDIVSFGRFTIGGNLSFSGYTGAATLVSATTTVIGNLTFGSGQQPMTGSQNFTMAPTGSVTITSNGVTVNRSMTFSGTGTTTLLDTLSLGTGTLGLSTGTFNAGNQNVTCTAFSSSNSNTRTLNMGSGTWTITGTGTVWNTSTGTNMTLNAGTSTIKISNASSSSKTFAGGAMMFYNLWLTGSGSGVFIIGTSTATTTFNDFKVDTPPHTVQFFAGKTINISSWTVSGSGGAYMTLKSTSDGVAWNLVDTSGTNSSDYISLQDSHASGGALFYAGSHSVDVSGNTGWIFTDPVPNTENANRDQNHVTTLLAAAASDGSVSLNVYANPITHALKAEDDTTGSDQGGLIAARDENHVPVGMATSSDDGITPIAIYANALTNDLLIDST